MATTEPQPEIITIDPTHHDQLDPDQADNPDSQLSTSLEEDNIEKPLRCCTFLLIMGLFFPIAPAAIALVIVVLSIFVPFVITTVLMICLVLLFILRLLELAIHSWKEIFMNMGEILSLFTFACSMVNIICGWEFWLIVVRNVDALKQRMIILELEPTKWIELCLVFSGFCLLMSIPRVILHFMSIGILEHKKGIFLLLNAFVQATECAVFLITEVAVLKLTPRWKNHVTFGFQTWRLIQVLALILLGTMLINFASHLIVLLIELFYGYTKHGTYLARGLRKSVNFMCVSILLMIVWLLCLDPYLTQPAIISKRASELISWGLVCLASGSVLRLVKKIIVLIWTAHAVYDRFHDKIVVAGIQFYFLCLLSNFKAFHEQKISDTGSHSMIWSAFTQIGFGGLKKSLPNEGGDEESRRRDKGILVQGEPRVPTYQLQQMAKYFEHIEAVLKEHDTNIASRFKIHLDESVERQNEATSNAILMLENTTQPKRISTSTDLQEHIKDISGIQLDHGEAEILYKQVEEKQGIESHTFEKWVVQAYRNCWELSNTIIGAKEVARYLNKVLTGFFLASFLLIWLFATKIATIELFVLLTSPILAATFIFGDTCKDIFQGIIFAFVMRLFDVGDVCAIDDTQMEVKRIGIWKTTLVEVGSNKKVTHQNSILAGKLIIKYKGGLDLNDSVEYSIPICHWTPTMFDKLKAEIDKYLDGRSVWYQKHALGVLVKEVGEDGVKIVIHLKHKPTVDMSMELECKRNECDAIIDMNVNSNSSSTPADPSTTPVDFPTWKIIIKVLGLIIWAIFFYCLLTLGTVMVISILLLVNTVIHLIDSMKGDAGYRTVVLSPISCVVSLLILLLAIIILSVLLGIIEAVDPSEQPILLGLDISQWIKIHIIVLGYYCVGTIMPDPISMPWLQGLLEAVKCLLFLPAMLLVMNVVPEWKHHSFVGLPT
ncbi:hypothetical protein Cgig2_007408 [Carnegiea gigantea]|uniref:Uncharacterized protein n=1 Tax=Carnegiea gigantea TaxID=171969 RepID=A0A9Q1KXW9_9CARY|nr:hypothetical protein Cgig2_007408 [Carnegiea gigantea]